MNCLKSRNNVTPPTAIKNNENVNNHYMIFAY